MGSVLFIIILLLVVLQISTLEALIGQFRSRVFSKFKEFSEFTNGGLYDCCGFSLPGRSVPTVMVFYGLGIARSVRSTSS